MIQVGKYFSTADGPSCLYPSESMDQTIFRTMPCLADMETGFAGYTPASVEQPAPSLAEPYYDDGPGTSVNAPIDAIRVEPGVQVTDSPAPNTVTVTQENPDPQPEPVTNKVMTWVKDNPMLAIGAAGLAVWLLTRKKRR